MEKIINIDGKNVAFKATAATPRLYRMKFRRDLMVDLSRLAKVGKKNKYDIPDLEMFENVAYIMAKQADDSIPNDVNIWLDNFTMFSIQEILPEIMELWSINTETLVESKKKTYPAAEK